MLKFKKKLISVEVCLIILVIKSIGKTGASYAKSLIVWKICCKMKNKRTFHFMKNPSRCYPALEKWKNQDSTVFRTHRKKFITRDIAQKLNNIKRICRDIWIFFLFSVNNNAYEKKLHKNCLIGQWINIFFGYDKCTSISRDIIYWNNSKNIYKYK